MGGYDYGTQNCAAEIWEYDIGEYKWTKLDIKLPMKMSNFGLALSSDERYLVMFGGENVEPFVSKIYSFWI